MKSWELSERLFVSWIAWREPPIRVEFLRFWVDFRIA
jgi:hypothetical protein